MLAGVGHSADAHVVVGVREGDDAGVVRVPGAGRRLLVHTLDAITPIVDEPRAFGRIAAANALSDVYAMGGLPTSAVAVLGLPSEVPPAAVRELLRAARVLLDDAGAPLVGGHTVKDRELKLGFAVTGQVERRALTTVAGVRAGDVLVLTKPLGTGVLWQASKAEQRSAREARAVVRGMSSLNRTARDAMVAAGARGATDVTGFGLAGHALNLATHSRVRIELWADALPTYPGVLDHIAAGRVPGTTQVNLGACGAALRFEPGVSDADRALAGDPQTSGGLLVALRPRRVAGFLAAVPGWVVGRALAGRAEVHVVRRER